MTRNGAASTGRHRVYGAGTVNGFSPERQRWPNEWLEVLRDQIVVLLREDHPQSLRHVFYRLTDPRLPVHVSKDEVRGYRRVGRELLALRRAGRVPYGWISDVTRLGWHVEAFDGAGDYLAQVAHLYRHDLWSSVEQRVEVWCESDSIGGVLRPLARELAVSLYTTKGFASVTQAYEAACDINQGRKPCSVLYVGDYDPAGVLIPATVERELMQHLAVDLDFQRVAVTREQIEQYDLPTKPRKRGERRVPHLERTVEVEAMPAGVLRGLVRSAVESYLPEGALKAAEEAEASERRILLELADELHDEESAFD